jgi:hypothetical protein
MAGNLYITLQRNMTPEAYQAMEAIITDFEQRFHAVEQAAVASAQGIQTAIQAGFENANFNIAVPPAPAPAAPAAPVAPPVRLGAPRMTLHTFSGKTNENVSAWISMAEEALTATQIPRDLWTQVVAHALQGAAQTWYVSLKREKKNQVMSWDEMKKALSDQWDNPTRINDLRMQLDVMRYNDKKMSITEYTRRFQEIESQIPSEHLNNGERIFKYIIHLPPELYLHLLPETRNSDLPLSHFCTAARNWESLRRLPQRLAAATAPQSNLPRFPKRQRSLNSLPPSITTMPHLAPPGPSTLYSEPMDLDAMNVSRDPRNPPPGTRCYNCNENGHFARDCRKPPRRSASTSPARPRPHQAKSMHLLEGIEEREEYGENEEDEQEGEDYNPETYQPLEYTPEDGYDPQRSDLELQYQVNEANLMELRNILTGKGVEELKEEEEEEEEEEDDMSEEETIEEVEISLAPKRAREAVEEVEIPRLKGKRRRTSCPDCFYWRVNGPDPELWQDEVTYPHWCFPSEKESSPEWRPESPDPAYLEALQKLAPSVTPILEARSVSAPAGTVLHTPPATPRSEDDDVEPFELNYIAHTNLPVYEFAIGPPKSSSTGPANADLPVKTILDTGAESNYMSSKAARAANAHIFPITKREIVGAGQTTTSAFAAFTLKVGNMIVRCYAYILNASTQFRYDLLLGRAWLKKYEATPCWEDDAYELTHLETKVHSYLRPISVQERGILSQALTKITQPFRPAHAHLPRVDTVFHAQSTSPSNDEENMLSRDDESTRAATGSSDTLATPEDTFRERLKRMVKETLPSVFRDKVGYPPLRKWVHDIDVGDAKPLRRYGRPLTPPEHEAIREFIDEALREGVIEPSDSPWSSPLLPVPKKDGTSRICVDYRALNKLTKSNAYPLPRIDECYRNLAGARFFTCLDLRSGYWQIRLADDAKEKTAFTCRYGHFQF